MNSSDARALLGKLHDLRAELVELAFVLDRRGRIDAADVAMTISGRVGELCEELTTAGAGAPGRREDAGSDGAAP